MNNTDTLEKIIRHQKNKDSQIICPIQGRIIKCPRLFAILSPSAGRCPRPFYYVISYKRRGWFPVPPRFYSSRIPLAQDFEARLIAYILLVRPLCTSRFLRIRSGVYPSASYPHRPGKSHADTQIRYIYSRARRYRSSDRGFVFHSRCNRPNPYPSRYPWNDRSAGNQR